VWDLGLPAPKPQILGFEPAEASPGAKVIIWGNQLLNTTAVSFNGVPATTAKNLTGQFVLVTVPTGATTGEVTVTTMNGAGTSRKSFTVQ
jgi:hypothetical protein